MKRKLAATAATAALAVASPATAAKPAAHGRAPASGGKPRVSRLADPQRAAVQQSLEVMRRDERRQHRRQLASALAAQMPRAGAVAVERGLAAAEADPAHIAASVARTTGASERQVDAAFEAMARHARDARLRSLAR
jgi:hypothetical protein